VGICSGGFTTGYHPSPLRGDQHRTTPQQATIHPTLLRVYLFLPQKYLARLTPQPNLTRSVRSTLQMPLPW
jgi:hypothetical protein